MKWISNIVAVALLMIPVMAQAAPVYDEDTQQRIIRAAYDRLTTYTVLSEESLAFELSNFETIYPDQFDHVEFLSLVSMPEGLVLDIHRAYQTNNNLGERRVAYEPSWHDMEAFWRTHPEAPQLEGLSIADVLELQAASDDETQYLPGSVESITAYTVTVTYGEQSRTYEAAFLWMPSKAPAGFSSAFLVIDNITAGVGEAVREPVAPLVNPDFLSLFTPAEGIPEKAYCSSWSQNFYQNGYANGSDDHVSGQHSAYANFKLTCSCNSTCYSTCNGGITSMGCSCSGVTWWCHQIGRASDVFADTRYGGGAACGAAYNCNVVYCFICGMCSVSVGVNVDHASVSFSNDTDHDWKANLKYTISACGPC